MRSRAPIFVVSWGGQVLQAFGRKEDAVAFSGEFPDATVSTHQIRQSMREAVTVYDRQVVVSDGARVVDRTVVVHQFVDHPRDAPGAADVEWFRDPTEATWHIAGFGTDAAALAAAIGDAVARINRLDREATPEPANGGARP